MDVTGCITASWLHRALLKTVDSQIWNSAFCFRLLLGSSLGSFTWQTYFSLEMQDCAGPLGSSSLVPLSDLYFLTMQWASNIRPVSFLLPNSYWEAVLIPEIREHLWISILFIFSVPAVYLMSLETTVASLPILHFLLDLNKIICLISAHNDLGIWLMYFLPGNLSLTSVFVGDLYKIPLQAYIFKEKILK